MIEFKTEINLSILVYRVKKSKVLIDLAEPYLFSFIKMLVI